MFFVVLVQELSEPQTPVQGAHARARVQRSELNVRSEVR